MPNEAESRAEGVSTANSESSIEVRSSTQELTQWQTFIICLDRGLFVLLLVTFLVFSFTSLRMR